MKSASKKYEIQIAKERKGRKTLASGALYYDKGDGKNKVWGWDCKITKYKSFTLKKEDWEKLERDLYFGEGLTPNLHIKLDVKSDQPLELVVIEKNDFYSLLDED